MRSMDSTALRYEDRTPRVNVTAKALLSFRLSGDPEIVAVHKLAGEFCSMLRVRTSMLSHLEGLAERLGAHGDLC